MKLLNILYPKAAVYIDHRTVRSSTVNYQFVHRQRYRHCSPERRCGEDFPQGTGTPPPDLQESHTQTIILHNCALPMQLYSLINQIVQ